MGDMMLPSAERLAVTVAAPAAADDTLHGRALEDRVEVALLLPAAAVVLRGSRRSRRGLFVYLVDSIGFCATSLGRSSNVSSFLFALDRV